MESQVIIRTSFILVKNKFICAYMERNRYFADHITGWLRGAVFVTTDLCYVNPNDLTKLLLCLAFSFLNEDKRSGKSI